MSLRDYMGQRALAFVLPNYAYYADGAEMFIFMLSSKTISMTFVTCKTDISHYHSGIVFPILVLEK